MKKISTEKETEKKLQTIRLINMHAERIKIDCTKENNVLDFGNYLLSGVLAVAPSISDIPKNKLSVLENTE